MLRHVATLFHSSPSVNSNQIVSNTQLPSPLPFFLLDPIIPALLRLTCYIHNISPLSFPIQGIYITPVEKKQNPVRLVFEDDTPVELGEDEWLQRIPSNSAMEALVGLVYLVIFYGLGSHGKSSPFNSPPIGRILVLEFFPIRIEEANHQEEVFVGQRAGSGGFELICVIFTPRIGDDSHF